MAQTGCTGTMPRCGVVVPSPGSASFQCLAEGTTANLATCAAPGPTGDDCVAGNACVGKCYRICDLAHGNADCPGGQVCGAYAEVQGGPPNGLRFAICDVAQDNCDPLLQDCADTAKGCYPSNLGDRCYTPGSTAEGQSCASANACVKGTACVSLGSGPKCYRICNPADGGAPTCTTGACQPVEGIDHGYCAG